MFERRGFGRRGSGGFRGSGERRFSRPFRETPVKVVEEYDVSLDDVSARGDGIAKVSNFIIFIPNTSKGDRIKIKITEVRGRHAIGEKIGEASEGESR